MIWHDMTWYSSGDGVGAAADDDHDDDDDEEEDEDDDEDEEDDFHRSGQGLSICSSLWKNLSRWMKYLYFLTGLCRKG